MWSATTTRLSRCSLCGKIAAQRTETGVRGAIAHDHRAFHGDAPGRDARRRDAETGQETGGERQARRSSSRPAPGSRRAFPTPTFRRPARASAAPRSTLGADIVLKVRSPTDEELPKAQAAAQSSSACSIPSMPRRSRRLRRPAPPALRSSGCRGSRARNRWTCCPRRRTSPATRR